MKNDPMNRNGYPAPDRLAAAVEAVVARYDPDQVILFGSAARGTMTENSDIDLLVIKSDHKNSLEREILEINGDSVDILTTNPEEAERYRLTAATVHHEALLDGRTVHYKNWNQPPVPVGPSWWSSEDGMIKSTMLYPDRAGDYLYRAEGHWQDSNNTGNRRENRCYHRHQAIEHCLKGLIIAQGRSFKHSHELNRLWDDTEAEGKKIPVPKDRELLARLTKYAQTSRYETLDDARDRQMLKESRNFVEAIIRHGQETIPRLSRETKQTLAGTPKMIKPSAP